VITTKNCAISARCTPTACTDGERWTRATPIPRRQSQSCPARATRCVFLGRWASILSGLIEGRIEAEEIQLIHAEAYESVELSNGTDLTLN